MAFSTAPGSDTPGSDITGSDMTGSLSFSRFFPAGARQNMARRTTNLLQRAFAQGANGQSAPERQKSEQRE
jgi:hypothetical protein